MLLKANKIHTFTGHDSPVYALERSENPALFYSGGGDQLVSEWNLDLVSIPKAIVNAGSTIYSIRNIPEKKWLLIGVSGGGLHVVDLTHGKETRFIVHHKSGVFDIVYSTEHNRLFTVSADGTMAVWSLNDLSLQQTFFLCKEKVRSLTLKPDGRELALACGDGTIRIFDPASLEEKKSFKAHELSANTVLYHPKGNYLVSGGRDAHINFWDPVTYALIQSVPAHNYSVYSFSFSPDASLFASSSRDKNVKIWDADSLEFLLRIDNEKSGGHKHSVNKVLWMEHENYLLSAGDDRTIMVWDIQKQK